MSAIAHLPVGIQAATWNILNTVCQDSWQEAVNTDCFSNVPTLLVTRSDIDDDDDDVTTCSIVENSMPHVVMGIDSFVLKAPIATTLRLRIQLMSSRP